MGYSISPCSTLHCNGNRPGYFNGPAFITDFAEYPSMLPYHTALDDQIFVRSCACGVIETRGEWTEEFMDWSRQLDAPVRGKCCLRLVGPG
jgi:hypothetical protein